MEHFQFDPRKGQLHKERHGVDLEWAQGLWDLTHIIIPAKDVTGERRYLIRAKIGSQCYAAVFTRRGEAIRLISCHRADRRLERIYEGNVQSQENS